MIKTVLLRIAMKIWSILRKVAAANPPLVVSSLGREGLIALLENVDGNDAINILRSGGAKIGQKVRLSRGIVIHNSYEGFNELVVGSNCHIGRQTLLDLAAPIRIGDRVTISMRCNLITHVNVGDSQCGIQAVAKPIEIDDDVYIGAGVTVLPGLRIGKRSVVGAGAVVTRNVGENELVAGVPARSIISRQVPENDHQ